MPMRFWVMPFSYESYTYNFVRRRRSEPKFMTSVLDYRVKCINFGGNLESFLSPTFSVRHNQEQIIVVVVVCWYKFILFISSPFLSALYGRIMSGLNPFTDIFRSMLMTQTNGIHQKMEDRVAVYVTSTNRC